MPADGGAEKQLTSNIHHDDGPDYSPDGKWIYINSDRSGKEAVWRFPSDGAGTNDMKAEMVVSDGLEDWFPHISPDGKRMVYMGYPAGTPTHNPRTVQIELKLVAINHGEVAAFQKTLVNAIESAATSTKPLFRSKSINSVDWNASTDAGRYAYAHRPSSPKPMPVSKRQTLQRR